jgi:hypothetical protein
MSRQLYDITSAFEERRNRQFQARDYQVPAMARAGSELTEWINRVSYGTAKYHCCPCT